MPLIPLLPVSGVLHLLLLLLLLLRHFDKMVKLMMFVAVALVVPRDNRHLDAVLRRTGSKTLILILMLLIRMLNLILIRTSMLMQ